MLEEDLSQMQTMQQPVSIQAPKDLKSLLKVADWKQGMNFNGSPFAEQV